jgi:rfaE bifunctional protein kinase chain/domain
MNPSEKLSFNDAKAIIDRINELKILIIGDTIIDEYNYVSFLGKPSKENIIATLYEETEKKAGGVLTSINILSSFCNNIDYITVMGDNKNDEDFILKNSADNINNRIVFKREFPTTKKTRFVARGERLKKLFEVYEMNDEKIEKNIESKILDYLNINLDNYDLVIVQDYGHGLITENLIEVLIKKAKFLSINAQINSGNFGYNIITKYHGATYYCLDLPEARMAVNSKYMEPEEIIAKLGEITNAKFITITMGKNGSLSYSSPKEIVHSPSYANKTIDTMSAGDAYYALSAPVLLLSKSIQLAALAGNLAGGIKVGVSGLDDSIDKEAFLDKLKLHI